MVFEVTGEAPAAEAAPKLKAPRQPRTDYGYKKEAVITLTGKETKYRGDRKAWFESVVAFNGQTVKAWEDSHKDKEESPRGWMRFFVQDGSVSLVSPQ